LSDKIKLLYVKWFDASFNPSAMKPEEYDPDWVIHTVGIFVKEDKKYISMATDFFERDGEYRHYHSIPKVNIIKKKWLS